MDDPPHISNTLTPSWSCCGNSAAHLAKPGDETVTLYADGTAVEIPNF
jgi:hypothetical protein